MNHQNKIVSIIVPVYKVEKYLDNCVQSLIAQTYKDLQIILVDDGSPDSCGEICDKWKMKDSRINVIHKENGGLSDARNTGVKHASGTYIYFVDSDDQLENTAVERAVLSLEKHDADIVISTHKSSDNTGMEDVLTGDEMFKQIFQRCCWEAWGKLYKSSLIAEMSFPEGKLYEDIAYTPYAVLKANKVVYMDDGAYYYTVRDDGIMGGSKSIIKVDLVEHLEALLDFLKEKHKNQAKFFLKWSIVFLCHKYFSVTDFNANRAFNTAIKAFYKKNKIFVQLIKNYRPRIKYMIFKAYLQLCIRC